MRQAGGYGGPVVHWWRSQTVYAGVGLDWRYEGIISGYAALYRKTGDALWMARLRAAAADLMAGQLPSGSFVGSQFELNPGQFGTPHEAAAARGLLMAASHLEDPEAAIGAAGRALDNLIRRLRNPATDRFADSLGGSETVPNKLATLALALLNRVEADGDELWLAYARSALDDVLRFQVRHGRLSGAIHQWASDGRAGDGRFFPIYNARCVQPLLLGARVLGDSRYAEAALGIVGFLQQSQRLDGSWPQVLYASGRSAEWPCWLAGSAEILRALMAAGCSVPESSLRRLLDAQLSTGGVMTGAGFAVQGRSQAPGPRPDWRDVLPVVGWNDKVLALLAELLPEGVDVPKAVVAPVSREVVVNGRGATYTEDAECIRVEAHDGASVFHWKKQEPWAACDPTVGGLSPWEPMAERHSTATCLPAWSADLLSDPRIVINVPRALLASRRRKSSIAACSRRRVVDQSPLLSVTFDIERDLPGPFESARSRTASVFLDRFLGSSETSGLRATFFLQAALISRLPDRMLEMLAQSSHSLGLHGFRHELWGKGNWVKKRPPATLRSRESALISALEIFALAALGRPVSFRAPNFTIDAATYRLLNRYGFTTDSSVASQRFGTCSPSRRGHIRIVPVSSAPLARLWVNPRIHMPTAAHFRQFDHETLLETSDAEFEALVDETLRYQVGLGRRPYLMVYTHNWEMEEGDGEANLQSLLTRLRWLVDEYAMEPVTALRLADELIPEATP